MMTTEPDEHANSPGNTRFSPVREGALVLTCLACIPYLTLKILWIFGSHIGIPDGSELLDHEGLMRVANGLTVLMDATAVTLAFALARSWGRRIPAWLIVGPMWIATGLLAPIVAAWPLDLLTGAASDSGSSAADFLQPWVFNVVYGGFGLQAAGLMTLLVLHVQQRWGRLWRGRVRDLPVLATVPATRMSVAGAAVLAMYPLIVHLGWACGANWFLTEDTDGVSAVVHAVNAGLVVLAIAGAAALAGAGRRTWVGRLDTRIPLAAAWVGSSAVGAWGLWLILSATAFHGDTGNPDGTEGFSAQLVGVCGVSVVVGAILVVTGAHLLTGWRAARTPDLSSAT